MNRHFLLRSAALAATFALAQAATAQQPTAQSTDETVNYRLTYRDQIEIQIFDEPDLSSTQRIDGSGQIRVPLIGNVTLVGKTVREAEQFIEHLYVENRILRKPMATMRVLEYVPREVNVLGEVGTPGALAFPPEIIEMDIVDVIAKAGGFTQVARKNRVEVTRLGVDGRPVVTEVNVDDMIRGRDREGRRFMVRPGDTVSVPASIF